MSKYLMLLIMSLGLSGTLAHARVRSRNPKTRNFETTLRLINLSRRPHLIANRLSQLTQEEYAIAYKQAKAVEDQRRKDFDQAYAAYPCKEFKGSLGGDQLLYGTAMTASIMSLSHVLGITLLCLQFPMIELLIALLPEILFSTGIFGISTGWLWYSRKERATRRAYHCFQDAREIAYLFG